jgi:hypothetical protein
MLQNEEKAVTPRMVESMRLFTNMEIVPKMIPAIRNIHQHLVPR